MSRPEAPKPVHLQATSFNDEDAKQAIARTQAPEFEYITSPQERLFAREFALTQSLTKSYHVAYPEEVQTLTPAQIRHKAAHLLSTPRVDEIFVYYKQAINTRMDIREERILQELACIAFSDPADYYEPDGETLKPIHQIPAHARAAISKFKTGFTADGRFTEVTAVDKLKALSLLVNIKNMDQENKAAKAPRVNIALNNVPRTETNDATTD